MAPVPPPTIDDLGVRGCLYLAALLMAQERRLPIAPTLRSSLLVLDQLRELGVIHVPWPELRWEIEPKAEETPVEQLQWRYNWSAYIRDGLIGALEEYLQSIPRDEYGIALRLRLWDELAVAEAERFFEQQLVKHQFDSTWAQDIVFAYRDAQACLSIAQWRYCCWAATRQGASVAQQQRISSAAAIREAIYSELCRRVNRVSTGAWGSCALPPFHPSPDAALCRLFTGHLTRQSMEFWTMAPSTEALLLPRVV